MKVYVTLCGTSILTNVEAKYRNAQEKSLFMVYANKSKKEFVPQNERIILENYINKAKEDLKELSKMPFDDGNVSKISAEINAYSKLFISDPPTAQDIHFLLSTDTWVGEEAAFLVKEWLKQKGFHAEVYRMRYVKTSSTEELQMGLSDLVKWFEENIQGFRDKNYKVIFNITGGFKVLMGFLQTIAHFYADEAVYVYENQKELIKIPRLPLHLDLKDEVKRNLHVLRRRTLGLPVVSQDWKQLPSLFYYKIGDDYDLSAWGELAFSQLKKELYSEELLQPLTNKIIYSDDFVKKVNQLPPDRIFNVNDKIDKLSVFIETGDQSFNAKSLNFKKLEGKPVAGSTHEFYAWSDRDAKRIFCHFENDILKIDKIEDHL